jgi:hypothetical protein
MRRGAEPGPERESPAGRPQSLAKRDAGCTGAQPALVAHPENATEIIGTAATQSKIWKKSSNSETWCERHEPLSGPFETSGDRPRTSGRVASIPVDDPGGT